MEEQEPNTQPPEHTPGLEAYLAARSLIHHHRVYGDAVQRYGDRPQLKMVVEECGELIAQIGRLWRGRCNLEEVAEECADVLIVCMQLSEILGGSLVRDAVDQKTARLAERLAPAGGPK